MSDKPVKTFRHRTLQLAVWKNVAGEHTIYKSVLSCSYKSNGEYRSTSSIDYYDLPAASALFSRASNWIAYQIERESLVERESNGGERGD